MKRLVLGILAHVDAGKTTLSEALLYTAGAIPALRPCSTRAAPSANWAGWTTGTPTWTPTH